MSDDGENDLMPGGSGSGGASGSAGQSAAGGSSGSSGTGRAADGSSGGSGGGSAAGQHRLEFMIGGNVLPYDMTVYQAVQQFGGSQMVVDHASDLLDADMLSGASAVAGRLYGSPGVWAR